MPTAVLAYAVKEFDLALDDLASNLEFVRAASRLRPRLKDMLRWDAMDSHAKALATTFLGRTAEESVLYRGLFVSLAGAFEQFVRRVLRDTVLAINGSGMNYDTLGDAIRRQNLHKTGAALQTIFEPPDHLEVDYDLLAKNLGTCFRGSNQPILNADAFTIFLSVFAPDRLLDALKRVGMEVQWDDFGKVQSMRTALEKQDTRETAKAVQEFLKRFGQTRNKIAHTGSSGVVITGADLEQLLKVFRTLARAVGSIVEAELRNFCRMRPDVLRGPPSVDTLHQRVKIQTDRRAVATV